MSQDALTLATLLGSRICHDLISPIGAISNGLELFELSGGPMPPEMELVASSVAGANARIKFYRIALGLASAQQSLGAPEIRSTLESFYADTRITADWHPETPARRDEVQAVFLALLCLGSAMLMGGTLTIEKSDRWQITGTAPKLRLQEPLWSVLTGAPAIGLQPADVQFALLPECAARLGKPVRYTTSETEISITL